MLLKRLDERRDDAHAIVDEFMLRSLHTSSRNNVLKRILKFPKKREARGSWRHAWCPKNLIVNIQTKAEKCKAAHTS